MRTDIASWVVAIAVAIALIPVHANREIWAIVNIATIATVVLYGFKVSKTKKEKENGGET